MIFSNPLKFAIGAMLVGIFLYACNGASNTKTTKNKDSLTTQSLQKPRTINHHVLISNITTHIFSDQTQKDTFKLVLTGDSLYTATAIFSIISYKGERIYADTFYGSDLFSNDDTIPASVANVESGIKLRVKSFYQNSAFIDTAYAMVQAGEGDSIKDSTFLDELDADRTIGGFQYSIGEEDDQCIAYSRKQHKVIVYWSCC